MAIYRPKNFIDEKGNTYGKLKVLSGSKRRNNRGSVYWICQCDCGRIVEKCGVALRQGKGLSCGCDREGRPAKRVVTG
jgi:hypothetical protein